MTDQILTVTDASFETDVLSAGMPVIVDFWAAWCGPCRMLAPEIERLAEKYAGVVRVAKVNVDENPALSQAFGIKSIPMIAFFPGGAAQPSGVMGFRTAEALEEQFGLAALAAK